jgi:hypothetical protein
MPTEKTSKSQHRISASSKLQLQLINKSLEPSSGFEQKGLKKVDISSLFRPNTHSSSSNAQVRVNQDASFRLLSKLKSNSSRIDGAIANNKTD